MADCRHEILIFEANGYQLVCTECRVAWGVKFSQRDSDAWLIPDEADPIRRVSRAPAKPKEMQCQ